MSTPDRENLYFVDLLADEPESMPIVERPCSAAPCQRVTEYVVQP